MRMGILATCVLFGLGCGNDWEPRSIVGATWSDDGERVLVSVTRWEERPFHELFGSPTVEERDGTVELWDVAPDGSDPRLVFGPATGRAVSAFFMRAEGYVLFVHEPRTNTESRDPALTTKWVRMSTGDGAIAELPWASYVPSPDGSTIARLEFKPSRPPDEFAEVTLQLMDAASLEDIGALIETGTEGRTAQLVWLDNERMAVQAIRWAPDGKSLVIVDVNGNVEPRDDVLDCWNVVTSSSTVNAEGEIVTAAVRPDGTFEVTRTPDGLPWPRRCYDSE